MKNDTENREDRYSIIIAIVGIIISWSLIELVYQILK